MGRYLPGAHAELDNLRNQVREGLTVSASLNAALVLPVAVGIDVALSPFRAVGHLRDRRTPSHPDAP